MHGSWWCSRGGGRKARPRVIERFGAILLAASLIAGCQTPGEAGQQTADTARVAEARQLAAEPANQSFGVWVSELRVDALEAGVSGAVFDAAFAGVEPDPRVLELDNRQPEFTRPIWGYLDMAVSSERIEDGRALFAGRRDLLDAVAARYGVPAPILVAIWGIESAYGAHTGDYSVIRSLATLAWSGRRTATFRRHLIAALLILEAGDIAPGDMRGSWAGAMGQTQFMPEAFRGYAVDQDGDGRRDLWGNQGDALASAANYLARAGWDAGASWGTEVVVPAGFPWEATGLGVKKPLSEWRQLGVRTADGADLPANRDMASILAPAGHRGAVFLVLGNFRAILRYNNSSAYALAVGHLADRIAGTGPFRGTWPRGDQPLSRTDKHDLQRLLTARGHETGGVDGVIGPNTRAAVRAYQRELGLVPDGYPTMALIDSLRRAAAGG